MKKCCGFCKHYRELDKGVTEYRGHIVAIGYCPAAGDNLEEMNLLALDTSRRGQYGNWDEEYRWASHVECNMYEQDDVSYNAIDNQYLREL